MSNRPDRPIHRTGADAERQAILRERGEGAHAEQDALADPDAVAGPSSQAPGVGAAPAEPHGDRVGRASVAPGSTPPAERGYDIPDPEDVHDAASRAGAPDPIAIDVTDPDEVHGRDQTAAIEDRDDPDGERIVTAPDEDLSSDG